MDPLKFKVCNMSKKDVPQVLEIIKAEKWNTGNHSIYSWLEVDPNGFKVAITDSEIVIGICSAVKNHQNFYFIGYYVVRKEYRGMGIGANLWKACMEHVGSRNCGLNAMPETVELYRNKYNFSIIEDQWCILCNGAIEDKIYSENLSDVIPEGVKIIPFSDSLLPFIFKYDFDICGYNRELALELNCKEKDSSTVVAFKHGDCVGFGTVKSSIKDVPQISPLYAEDEILAETMLKRLLESFSIKKGFSMKTFSNNQAVNSILKKIGCPTNCKLTRMYKHSPDFNVSTKRVYGILDVNCAPV